MMKLQRQFFKLDKITFFSELKDQIFMHNLIQ